MRLDRAYITTNQRSTQNDSGEACAYADSSNRLSGTLHHTTSNKNNKCPDAVLGARLYPSQEYRHEEEIHTAGNAYC